MRKIIDLTLDEDDVLILDDDQEQKQQLKHAKRSELDDLYDESLHHAPILKKKKTIKEKLQFKNIHKFLEPDEEIYKSDESESSAMNDENDEDEEITPKMREMMHKPGFMSMLDTRKSWYEALQYLKTDKVQEFLMQEIVKRSFRPVEMLMTYFGDGENAYLIQTFFEFALEGRIIINQLDKVIRDKCILCNKTRNLHFDIVLLTESPKNDEIFRLSSLGYSGPHCYDFKFSYLLELAQLCRKLAWDFNDDSEEEIKIAIDNINSGIVEMKRFYESENDENNDDDEDEDDE